MTLSVSYALMSFIVAHSELIMWLDAFIYLPLVILGIHRLMDQRKPTLLFVSYFLLFITNYYFGFYDWVVFLPVLFCTNVYRLATI